MLAVLGTWLQLLSFSGREGLWLFVLAEKHLSEMTAIINMIIHAPARWPLSSKTLSLSSLGCCCCCVTF